MTEGMAVHEFVKKHLDLINLERQAEIEQTSDLLGKLSVRELERRGICLLKLHITSQATGLYGRTVLTFVPSRAQGQEGKLPAHNFGSGDIAGVSLSHGDTAISSLLVSGIVSKVTSSSVAVAFEESVEGLTRGHDDVYKLTKLANDVTYRRLKSALNELDEYRAGPAVRLIEVLFGEAELGAPIRLPAPADSDTDSEGLTFFNDSLNKSQQDAVTFALGQREVAIIHGPPGTGKTTTVVEVIQQAVKHNMKVLACAPSNVAVDNLLERLAANQSCRLVRLGHPARLLPTIQRFALDAILATSDGAAIVRDIRKDIDGALSEIRKTKDKEEKRRLRDDMRYLRKDLKSREKRAIHDILMAADVILATNTSASTGGPLKSLKQGHFDLVVIDECAQAVEAACWIPLLHAPRCLLAGDHRQLPATIMSRQAAKEGLATSLMERVIGLHSNRVVQMLTTQYRMNDSIMKWSSDQLYNGRLLSHSSVASHLLRDLPGVIENEDTSLALLLIDTASCDVMELELEDEISKGNEGEADLVAFHVDILISSGLSAAQIAVIAPYNLQVDLLRLRLSGKYPGLEIKSVDGFQGREKEAVVISLVRSNDKGELGFLTEDRRINVAITRARRHLAVVCDSQTVGKHPFLKSLLDYMTDNGEVRTAFEYDDVLNSVSDVPRPAHLVFKAKKSSASGSSAKTHHNRDGARPKQSTMGGRDDGVKVQGSQDPAQRSKDDATFENEMKRRLSEFKKEPKETLLEFLPELNSHHRYVIHELADGLGLHHVSVGDRKDRHIVVTKENGDFPAQLTGGTEVQESCHPCNDCGCTDTNLSEEIESLVEDIRDENVLENLSDMEDELKDNTEVQELNESVQSCDGVEKAEVEETKEKQTNGIKGHSATSDSDAKCDDLFKCRVCKKLLPLGNVFLHEIQCEKIQAEKQRQNAVVQNKHKKKTEKKKQKQVLEEAQEEDFSTLVAMAVKRDNVCNFVKCREKITILGQTCKFCMKRYCFTHHVPEVHGCEVAARHHVRHQTLKSKVMTNGSGVREKKVDPVHKANLQRKMEARLNQMGEQRHRKQKSK